MLAGRQREHILREQLRQIQKELGEGEEGQAEIAELREQIEKAGMSEEAEKQAQKELKRLERMPEASAEHGMIRSYLDWLIELPWSKLSEERIDIAEARRILDEEGGVDFSYVVGQDDCRFRVSLFRQRGRLSLVARRAETKFKQANA